MNPMMLLALVPLAIALGSVALSNHEKERAQHVSQMQAIEQSQVDVAQSKAQIARAEAQIAQERAELARAEAELAKAKLAQQSAPEQDKSVSAPIVQTHVQSGQSSGQGQQ